MMKTRVVNKTGLHIDFDVEDNGTCPLRGLPPGGSRSVSLSLVLKCCRERGSVEWPIRVLINKKFYGMCLHPYYHLLKMTRIVIRYEWREDGSCVPILEGVGENFFDRVFRCCINWEKRDYVEIAKANSSYSWPINISAVGDRSLGDPNNVVGLGLNNISEEAAAAEASPTASGRERDRVVVVRAFPAKKRRIRRLIIRSAGGGRTNIDLEPADHLNSGGGMAVERRRLISLIRRRDVYIIGLLLAFTLVACVRFFC